METLMLSGTKFYMSYRQASFENLYLNKFNTLNIYSMNSVLLCVNDFNFLFEGSYLV